MPLYPKHEDVLIHTGRYFTAEWYYSFDAGLPALDYYNDLSELDQDRFDDVIRYLCESKPGIILPKTYYRIEDHAHQIYALKPRDERFFNFMTVDAKVIITNAYHKHSQQMTKVDRESLKIAVRCKQDYLRRVKEGTYYER